MALQRLKDAAEKAKKDLSGVSQTQISLPFISAGENGPLHLEVNLTRSKFEELSDSLIRRTMEPTRQAMKDAGLTNSEIQLKSHLSWWVNSYSSSTRSCQKRNR